MVQACNCKQLVFSLSQVIKGVISKKGPEFEGIP